LSEVLKQTIARLPDIMGRNAASMMQRILQATQEAIGAAPNLGPTSYPALVLKASNDDLVRFFDVAIKDAMIEVQRASQGPAFAASGLMGLSIEPIDPANASADSDFSNSTAAFERLSAKATGLGVRGLSACSKNMLLAALEEAFTKSQIGPVEAKAILPHARRALDNELVKLYEKLDSL
jgi:hypothetical protein